MKEKFVRVQKFFGKITPTKRKRKKKACDKMACRALPDELDGPIARPALFQQKFDSVEGDCESSTSSFQEDQTEFKLFYEMWCISCWTVSVKQVQEKDGELSFTISLEEASKPEGLNWNVSKSQTDIRLFYCCLQDRANLPSIAELLESTENTMNDKFKQQASATLEAFLQELVKDSQLGQSTEVFRFLCPLEQLLTEESNGEVWSLLRNMAYFMTQMDGEEEDVGAPGPAQLGDPGTEAMGPEGLAETEAETEAEGEAEDEDEDEDEEADLTGSCDGRRRFTAVSGRPPSAGSGDSGDSSGGLEEAPLFQAARLPVTCQSEDDPPGRESHSRQDDGGQQYDCTDGLCLPTKAKYRERVEQPNKKELDRSGKGRHDVNKAIIDLLKEISGNGIIISAIEVILKLKYSRRWLIWFLNKINRTEPQIASYIDMLRKKQWPGGVPVDSGPGQTRTSEQKRETEVRAHQLINSSSIPFFLKIDVDAVFKIFQDTKENKKLIYMLLSFLLRELMPGESSLNVLNSPA
ncbi:uncharacterized protein LOC133123938 [Conger conger]|uniref:uncharacterized protein LOC133123938 n=1 Tax=Conger conger TaxID=82655 RepID=UPI002A5A2CBB|nr:uncharacterized protein LOC133123938 [Conger conger]